MRSFRHDPVRASLALLALLAAACAGSRSTAPAAVGAPAVAARLHADVAWLADDAREGRRAGTPGEAASAQWIAARFAELGLEPAGADGYLQPFEVPLPPRDGGESTLRLPGTVFIPGPGALAPLFCAESGLVEGELVDCGYGIADARLGRDDFADAGTRIAGAGRVALIARGVPPYAPSEATGPGALAFEPDPNAEEAERDKPPTSWAGSGSLFLKVMNAKRRGFAAVLIAQHPDDSSAIPPFDPSQGARAGIPALAISAELAEVLSPGWAGRVRETDGVRRAEPPRAGGRTVVVRADVRRETATATNVLARIRGRDAHRNVVVGAHFDHLGRGGPGSLAPEQAGAIHNGADDNASGTAVVLELARRWAGSSPEARPDAGIVFALWSGEELGLLGSEHWASAPTVDLATVLANLNLDMVGRAGDGKLAVLGAGSSAPFAAWLADAGPHAGLALDVSLSGQGLGGSDHQVFLRRGIPALHLFSGVHTDYHKPSDDIERFEAGGAARVADLANDLVHRMVGAEELAFVEPPAGEAEPAQRERGFSVWFGTVPTYGADVKGLLLSGTSAGSPAEKAGLLAGDVITRVGDVAIDTIHDFVYMLQVYKPGDVVLAKYLRDGVEHEVRITLATRAAE
jgi:hypothetical protein